MMYGGGSNYPWLGRMPMTGAQPGMTFPTPGGGGTSLSPYGMSPQVMQLLLSRRNPPQNQGSPLTGQFSGLFSEGTQGFLDQLRQRFSQGPIMDNRGLSSLWSKQVGQPTQSPFGWNTTTSRAQSPIGGLLGRIFG